jgi:hypothetical protein
VALSFEDAVVAESADALTRLLSCTPFPGLALRHAQRRAERRTALARRELVRWNEQMGAALSFTGGQA